MSEETGDQHAPGGGPGETPEPALEPVAAGQPRAEATQPVAPAVPPAPVAAPPAGAAVTTTTVESGGSGRPGWLTGVLAGLAVLVLLGAGFGIGRWTDGGGDHGFRFSNGRDFPGGRGFAGPRFGPNGNGNGNGNGPSFGGPNGNGFNGPGPNGGGFGNRGRGFGQNNQNDQNGSSGSGSGTATPQPVSPLQ
jgi:hypothetical protein